MMFTGDTHRQYQKRETGCEVILIYSLSYPSALWRMVFILFLSERRSSIIRLPQVRHTKPISAPIRTTFHSYPPHGWGFRIRIISSKSKSGSIFGLYHSKKLVYLLRPLDQYGSDMNLINIGKSSLLVLCQQFLNSWVIGIITTIIFW